MNNTKITNIADGDVYEGSKDAVNGGQLWSVQPRHEWTHQPP